MLLVPNNASNIADTYRETNAFANFFTNQQVCDCREIMPAQVIISARPKETVSESGKMGQFQARLQSLPSSVSGFFETLTKLFYEVLGVTEGYIYYPATTPDRESNKELFWNRGDESLSILQRSYLFQLVRSIQKDAYRPGKPIVCSGKEGGKTDRWIVLPLCIGSSLRGVICLPLVDSSISTNFYSLLFVLLTQTLEEVALNEIAYQFSEQEQRRAEAGQNIGVREAERRHIAAELHDELGQSLTALQLQLSVLFTPDMDVEQIERLGQQANDQIGGMLSWVRSLAQTLNPHVLKDHDLLTAIEILLAQFRAGAKISITSNLEPLRDRFLPQPLSLAIYRIIQEATTNVIRYASAHNLCISIHLIDDSQLQIEVRDDGCGFTPSLKKQGNGLNNIRERAVALGGAASVLSTPGAGTVITATLPLPAITFAAGDKKHCRRSPQIKSKTRPIRTFRRQV